MVTVTDSISTNDPNDPELKGISYITENNTVKIGAKPEDFKTTEVDNYLRAQQTRSERKVIMLLVSVSVAFFLCFTMNQTISFLTNIGIVNAMYGKPLYTISVMIAFLNCLINPIIYVIQYSNFRTLLFQTLTCGHC
jgi:hypothetical protein